MNTSRDWEKPVRRLERLMRLKSFPVAFKLVEDKKFLSTVPFLRRMNNKSTLCQLINLVRNFDWTLGADLDDFMSVMCASVIGLTDLPDYMKDGTFRSIVWTKSRADAKKYENGIPRLPAGKYEAVAMAPLVYNPFEPDIVLIYANPAQMILLINALAACQHLVIPVQTEFLAMKGLERMLHTLNMIGKAKGVMPPYTIMPTMFDKRTNLAYQVAAEAEKYFDALVFKTMVPRNVRLSEAPSFGKPILLYDATSAGAQSYFELAKELLKN